MPRACAYLLVLVLVSALGCFSPASPRCAITCVDSQNCPTGNVCLGDGFCHDTAQETELCSSSNPDGSDPDGSPRQACEEPPSTHMWLQLDAGRDHTCGIDGQRKLYCWGDAGNGKLGVANEVADEEERVARPTLVDDGPWLAVSAGTEHTCAIKQVVPDATVGEMWCWGVYYAVGSTGPNKARPVKMDSNTTWAHVSAGHGVTCGIRTDRHLLCWGNDPLITQSATDATVNIPKVVGDGVHDWLSVSVGGGHACGLRDRAGGPALYCWGSGASGQLGNHVTYTDPTPGTSTPVEVQVAGVNEDGDPDGTWDSIAWAEVEVGDAHTCALTADAVPRLFCWGISYNFARFSGYGLDDNQPIEVVAEDAQDPWAELYVGHHMSCARTASNAVICAGYGDEGQLGTGERNPQGNRHLVEMPGLDGLTIGERHACALDAAGLAYCWGDHGEGQLGTGEACVPDLLGPDRIGDQMWKDVTLGLDHACGLLSSGHLRCWGGGNARGTLGTIDGIQPVPVPLPGDDRVWDSIDAGHSFTCGISEGEVLCWGAGEAGKLGTGNETSRTTPQVTLTGLTFTQVSAGPNHACAVAGNKLAYCWGYNGDQQVQEDSTDPKEAVLTPVQVPGGQVWRAISAGAKHTCAIRYTGELYCWGHVHEVTLHPTPTLIDAGTDWLSIAAGAGATCGVRGAAGQGTLWCWGWTPATGHAGVEQPTPTQVGLLTDWSEVAAATNLTCGVADDQVQCAGGNAFGELGRGDQDDASLFAPVLDDPPGSWAHVDVANDSACGLRNDELYCWGRGHAGQLGNGLNAQVLPRPVAAPQ